MTIPDYQTLMLPLLQYVAEGQRHGREAANFLADKFHLIEEERSRLLPTGRKQLMRSRVDGLEHTLHKLVCCGDHGEDT